ncbi:MAG: hypothetical protein ACI4SM_00260 [Candidatus Gastranaerophilaceae bacterium]
MQKYCAKCDKIFSSTANYCSWCGENMAKYKEYPDFDNWKDRTILHHQMQQEAQQGNNFNENYKPVINKQLSLF